MIEITGKVILGSIGFTGRVDFMYATISSRPDFTFGLCWMYSLVKY